jgi:ribosomal protein L11 methyltransferase
MLSIPSLWQCRILCPPVTVSYLQELLWTLPGVESVTEIYRPNPERDESSRADVEGVTVLFQSADAERDLQALLQSHPKLGKVCQVEDARTIQDADWVDQWKKHWHPTRVTSRLVICPTWQSETYRPERPDERILLLDPENAFGTGTHETTCLVLSLLERLATERDLSQCNLLDIGTGSGILAIDAALQGCRDIRGLDNDPFAVETARKNAAINGVGSFIDFSDTPLNDTCQTRYDVVLINIIAPVILSLWDDILLRLKPGSTLIASGLIEKSVGSIQDAMQRAGFQEIEQQRQGDWFALQGRYVG